MYTDMLHIHIHIYIYMYICNIMIIYIYIYVYHVSLSLSLYICHMGNLLGWLRLGWFEVALDYITIA